MFWRQATGRSDVLAPRAMVATSQPLATQAGISILKEGGNAVDAAIASAAVLDVVEPFSTGCGGDAFALVHIPDQKKPLSYNGSGRSGSLATLDSLLSQGLTEMPERGGPTVNVPGAMHLWYTLQKEHGNLEMSDVLKYAIGYAKNGFLVSPVISEQWKYTYPVLRGEEARHVFTIEGLPPSVGTQMRNPELAKVFSQVGREGLGVFYNGWIAEAIVKTVQEDGGFLTLEDMAAHRTEVTNPISTSYRGLDVYEHPPNGQGFAALAMLNIMERFSFDDYTSTSAERYHIMIEAKKLAYDDLYRHNADPDFYEVPLEPLLSKEYAKDRATSISLKSTLDTNNLPMRQGTDTVYFCTADANGMAVSFINSLYMGFGSGLVAQGTGIKLQNRANLFSLDPLHPNCYAPRKRVFHTIIPGALYRDGTFVGVFGIMGGSHQAQAHAQFVSNLVDYNMSPQEALDHPRFHHEQVPNTVAVEDGLTNDVQPALQKLGHQMVPASRFGFGGGQAILQLESGWIAGSDYRKDGQASGF